MVERGERLPSDDRLIRLAELLELSDRELLALKYEATERSQVGRLLAPPTPELPRLRRFLLGTCRHRRSVKEEFEHARRGTLERAVWQAVMSHVVLPELDADRFAPRRLRERVEAWRRHRRREPSAPLEARWFEDHADLFVPFARGLIDGWSWEPAALTLRIDRSTPPKETVEVRLVAGSPPPRTGPAPEDLSTLLTAQGLAEDDIDELITLVELKRRRAARRNAD